MCFLISLTQTKCSIISNIQPVHNITNFIGTQVSPWPYYVFQHNLWTSIPQTVYLEEQVCDVFCRCLLPRCGQAEEDVKSALICVNRGYENDNNMTWMMRFRKKPWFLAVTIREYVSHIETIFHSHSRGLWSRIMIHVVFAELRVSPKQATHFTNDEVRFTCFYKDVYSLHWSLLQVGAWEELTVYVSGVGISVNYRSAGRHSVELNPDAGSCLLHIRNISMEDAGTYICRRDDGTAVESELIVLGE